MCPFSLFLLTSQNWQQFRPTFMLVFTLTIFCSIGMAQMVRRVCTASAQRTWVQSLVREDPLAKEMAITPNILAFGEFWTSTQTTVDCSKEWDWP